MSELNNKNDNLQHTEHGVNQIIKDVWASNLDVEFNSICKLVETHRYRYIAMDTEYPGVVFNRGDIRSFTKEQYYEQIRTNVNSLKLLQLGLTFMDESGSKYTTWQFNFKFDKDKDLNDKGSIHFLTGHGIPFNRLREEGIEPEEFGGLMYGTGAILLEIEWITFQGGFDFGYLLKMLTNTSLPLTRSEFEEDLKLYFNSFYDVRCFTEHKRLTGSLLVIAGKLNIKLVGNSHNSGSDSLTTAKVFNALGPSNFEEYNRRLMFLS